MIPLELQTEVRNRMEREFAHLTLKNILGDQVAITVFEQHLPIKTKKDTDPYPCIVVRLADGSHTDSQYPDKATLQFIIGVVDRDSNNQGYKDAVRVANRISENLQRSPMVNKKFELQLPMTWTYHDEDSEPYYFVGLETNWETPQTLREDVEEYT